MNHTIYVAVIGAGAAGLCAARHLKSNPLFRFTVYECQEDIGGTWVYTEESGKNKYGLPIHSSMYRDLRTNLPKEIMGFPDYPFPSGGPSFIHHSEVLQYLKNYSQHFDLYKYIEFSSEVKEVKPVKMENNKTIWNLKIHHLVTDRIEEKSFNAVMVCNGHYSDPQIPQIPGLDKFHGLVMHSHAYRSCEVFQNMKVVILGANHSGCDIALEIANVAKEIILSHNQPFISSPFPSNVCQKPGIASIDENRVTFLNDENYEADAILFCTGYNFNFDFLHSTCGVNVTEQRVTPLYKHLIHTEFPTLAIFGVLFRILPFPIFHQQVLFFLKVLSDDVVLPRKEDMDIDTEKEFQNRKLHGFPVRYSHKMGSLQWVYDKELSHMGSFPSIDPVVIKLYNYVSETRKMNFVTYKDKNYCILDDNFICTN